MYGSVFQNGVYSILKEKKQLQTPAGNSVITQYRELADRLVKDLDRYGEDPSNPLSLVAFHYAMIDFFSKLPRAELEANVAMGLSMEHDWTLNCRSGDPLYSMKWRLFFGDPSYQVEQGCQWLPSLSLMQLAAVCVIGRALESVNIPFVAATSLERAKMQQFCKKVNSYYPYVSAKDIQRYLENYLFYYDLPAQQEKPAAVPTHIDMDELIQLIDTKMTPQKLAKLKDRYKLLQGPPDMLFGGVDLQSTDKKLEMHIGADKHLETIFLFVNQLSPADVLFGGITPGSKKDEVHKKLGVPTHSNDFGDRYDNEKYCCHISYNQDSVIRQITLMSARSAP